MRTLKWMAVVALATGFLFQVGCCPWTTLGLGLLGLAATQTTTTST